MSHVARSLAVPTYHIRPIGETVSCHNGQWWAPLPAVSPGIEPRSNSSLVRPRHSGTAPQRTIRPSIRSIETCSRNRDMLPLQKSHGCCRTDTTSRHRRVSRSDTATIAGPRIRFVAVLSRSCAQGRFIRSATAKPCPDPPAASSATMDAAVRVTCRRVRCVQFATTPRGKPAGASPLRRRLAPAEVHAARDHEQLADATPGVPARPAAHARYGRQLRRSGRRLPALRLPAEKDHGCHGRRRLGRGRDLCRFVGSREQRHHRRLRRRLGHGLGRHGRRRRFVQRHLPRPGDRCLQRCGAASHRGRRVLRQLQPRLGGQRRWGQESGGVEAAGRSGRIDETLTDSRGPHRSCQVSRVFRFPPPRPAQDER